MSISYKKEGKRALDLLFASSCLTALGPLCLIIGAAIRLDTKGPVIFRQKRLGRLGKTFDILKFRTMHERSEVVIGDDGTVVNPRDDRRVTRVGALLRHTSLDELPQLVNVVFGEMSLIGPRPDLPEALEMYTADERDKLKVRPGITGLSQVSGRNRLEAHEKWNLDAHYANHLDLTTDIKILLKTIGNVVMRRDIYKESQP